MSEPRFFQFPLPNSGTVELSVEEARHASQVLRLIVGAPVVLFDGQGGEAQGVIEQCSKRQVRVEIASRTDTNRELARPLELLVALPKGDRQKTLVDGLVQFGTTRLTPLVCARGVAQPTGGALQRLQRGVLEASKQCGRNWLLSIGPPLTLEQATDAAASPSGGVSLVAHPYGVPRPLDEIDLREPTSENGACGWHSARVAIGPEGGFTEEEVALLRDAGWTQVSLGPRLLRIEYAALQVAAWWATLRDNHNPTREL